jgi:Short C-terminal domain
MSIADELEKLANLRDKGVLTEDEFLFQKAKILGKKEPPIIENVVDQKNESKESIEKCNANTKTFPVNDKQNSLIKNLSQKFIEFSLLASYLIPIAALVRFWIVTSHNFSEFFIWLAGGFVLFYLYRILLKIILKTAIEGNEFINILMVMILIVSFWRAFSQNDVTTKTTDTPKENDAMVYRVLPNGLYTIQCMNSGSYKHYKPWFGAYETGEFINSGECD